MKPITFTHTDSFAVYCKVIGHAFCPYLLLSESHEVLYRRDLVFQDCSALIGYQAELLFEAIRTTEDFRNSRREHGPKKGLMYCVNLTFPVPSDPFTSEQVIEWPHWILKCLYSEVGVMFGKFWVTEETVSQDGRMIPSPPLNFLSIRSAIKARDPHFLDNTPELLQSMLDSLDSGQNVFENIDSAGEAHAGTSSQNVLRYLALKEWAKGKLPT